MMLKRIFAKCKTWRCRAEISLDEIPGFYFYGNDDLHDVIVRSGGDVSA